MTDTIESLREELKRTRKELDDTKTRLSELAAASWKGAVEKNTTDAAMLAAVEHFYPIRDELVRRISEGTYAMADYAIQRLRNKHLSERDVVVDISDPSVNAAVKLSFAGSASYNYARVQMQATNISFSFKMHGPDAVAVAERMGAASEWTPSMFGTQYRPDLGPPTRYRGQPLSRPEAKSAYDAYLDDSSKGKK